MTLPPDNQEPEQAACGTTHYAGCACHEQGWEKKWRCAIEMAARANIEAAEWKSKYEALAAQKTPPPVSDSLE